jgi:hypothetical protein
MSHLIKAGGLDQQEPQQQSSIVECRDTIDNELFNLSIALAQEWRSLPNTPSHSHISLLTVGVLEHALNLAILINFLKPII